MLHFCFAFVASDVGVDKETLARKNVCCLSTSKRYPLAGSYEYSKCKFLLGERQVNWRKKESNLNIFLFLTNIYTSNSVLTIILI